MTITSNTITSNVSQIDVSSRQLHPSIFLNNTEIAGIKAKIASNIEPWKTAYTILKPSNGIANSSTQNLYWAIGVANRVHLPTVIDGTNPSSAGCNSDKHNYCTTLPPDVSERTDYNSAQEMAYAVRTLGLAYAFEPNDITRAGYADKALKLIKNWCINADTKMNPIFQNWPSIDEITLFMTAMFYGADLIWNYSGWSQSDKTALQTYARTLATNAKNYSGVGGWYGNTESMRLMMIAACGVIADDPSLLSYVYMIWRNTNPANGYMFMQSEVAPDGHLLKIFSTHPCRTLTYSTYSLHMKILIAEIARHKGVDLYNFTLPNGANLEKALDFLNHPTNIARKFLIDPDLHKTTPIPCKPPGTTGNIPDCGTWATRWFAAGYRQCCCRTSSNTQCEINSPNCYAIQTAKGYLFIGIGQDVSLYEYGNLWKSKPNWMEVITKWGRPMFDWRFGHETLTHAQGAYPFIF